MNAYPTTFAFVQIHHGDAYATAWGNARANFYTDFGGYPTSYFDGTLVRAGAWPYSTYLGDYNTRRAVATDVTISLAALGTGPSTYEVDATVGVQTGGTTKTMRIYIVQVLDYWPTVVTYSRNGFKQAATTVDVTLGSGQSQVIQRTFTFDANSMSNLNNVKIIAWAQEPQNTSPLSDRANVYQAAILPYSAFAPDCNHNGVPDAQDIASGFSEDCNSNGIPDECELHTAPVIIEQLADSTEAAAAQNFNDSAYPTYTIKEWDDFTVSSDVLLGTGEATFDPTTWGGYSTIPFLVEVATAPGGAQAGATVVASTTGTGSAGIVSWDFAQAPLPAGTYWLSVQAGGGFDAYGMVQWRRSNVTHPNGSQHYFHNPGGGWGHGTVPAPYSTWSPYQPGDLAFTQRSVVNLDCNSNGVPDACDILSGTSDDDNHNGVPDECEAPPVCRGDANCDGVVSLRDIDYFVAAMSSESAWEAMFSPEPDCDYDNNDVNDDGVVNWRDIDPFVALMGTTCP